MHLRMITIKVSGDNREETDIVYCQKVSIEKKIFITLNYYLHTIMINSALTVFHT